MKEKEKKTNGDVEKIEAPSQKSIKRARTRMVCVTLKRVSPRNKAKRDILNATPKNVSKKKNSRKSKKPVETFEVHQTDETSQSSRSKDGRSKKSFEKTLDVPNESTSINSSAAVDQIYSLLEKVNNDSAEIMQQINTETSSNCSVPISKTRNKVTKKMKRVVPDAKNKKNSCLSEDFLTTKFMTPTGFTKSKIRKTTESDETPLSKKVSLKLDGLSGKGKKKGWKRSKSALKEKEYEDDLFESRKFNELKENLFMDDDSDTYESNIATPKCAFLGTPLKPKKTPRIKDCYNPVELMKARKLAEEYICSRNERKLQNTLNSENPLQERNMI